MHPVFIGIDVSKAHLDVCVRPLGEERRYSNDARGIAELVARLGELSPSLVVLEAIQDQWVAVIDRDLSGANRAKPRSQRSLRS